MNQNYMIATSVKIDLSKAKFPKINDFYFRRQKTTQVPMKKKSTTDEDIFQSKKTVSKMTTTILMHEVFQLCNI